MGRGSIYLKKGTKLDIMKTRKEETKNVLLNFTISKKDALSLEGGPETERGTVITPVSGDQ
jgi:hypothetical protein